MANTLAIVRADMKEVRQQLDLQSKTNLDLYSLIHNNKLTVEEREDKNEWITKQMAGLVKVIKQL